MCIRDRVYGLRDGLLRAVGGSVNRGQDQQKQYAQSLAALGTL